MKTTECYIRVKDRRALLSVMLRFSKCLIFKLIFKHANDVKYIYQCYTAIFLIFFTFFSIL